MKISNFKIRNFRNILHADVKFENINIFTGKNSSGKTNLLLAICHSLHKKVDLGQIFFDNIVTLGRGIRYTTFTVTINDPGHIYLQKYALEGGSRQIAIKGKEMIFENLIAKKTLSPVSQKIFFTGEYKTREITTDISKSIVKTDHKFQEFINETTGFERLKNQLVYHSKISDLDLDGSYSERLVEFPTHPDSSEFEKMFSRIPERIWSFTDDTQSFSSSLILKYVTQRIESHEEYDLIVKRLKDRKTRFGDINKSKFVYLIADIQKNRNQANKFKNDLELYTEGIISNIHVCTSGARRGQLVVEAPNTPSSIQDVSAGTAVLLFFVTLKNWIQLPFRDKSYLAPSIMFFDEVDSIIHASMIPIFSELLKSISKDVQLFISTHSPYFIDEFSKENIFYLKDFNAIPNEVREETENIYSYQEILKRLPANNKMLMKKPNSLLFVDGLIDAAFPFKK